MKKNLFLILLLAAIFSNALYYEYHLVETKNSFVKYENKNRFKYSKASSTVYYVRKDGLDSHAGTANSSGSAFLTLKKAVSVAVSGDSIVVAQVGTYLENGTMALSEGVSIHGVDSANCIIQDTVTNAFTEMLRLYSSTEGTNGNQSISGLKFDGQLSGTTGGSDWGIYIAARSNVIIHDCQFKNFRDRAVIWTGRTDNTAAAPTIYSTGNRFYNCTMQNCAGYNRALGYGAGELNIGGQDGFSVDHSNFVQNQRPSGYNGWCLKYYHGGFNKALQIHDDTLTRIQFQGSAPGDYDWNFSMEFWHIEGGMNIYNNVCQGAFDLVQVRKRSYPYGIWIHNNTISQPTQNSKEEDGLNFEIGVEGAIVENNTFNNLSLGVVIQAEFYAYDPQWDTINIIKQDTFRFNKFSNIGGVGLQAGFLIVGGSTTRVDMGSFAITNNSFSTSSGTVPYEGVYFNLAGAPGHIGRVDIVNNIFKGFADSYLKSSTISATWDTLVLKNNLRYSNGSLDSSSLVGTPTTTLKFGNIVGNPKFVSNTDLRLLGGSPAIDAGLNIGYAYSGSAPDIGFTDEVITPPTANAGVDSTITLPTSSVHLIGSGTNGSGTINKWKWVQISGTSATITQSDSAHTTVTGLTNTSKFQLTVTTTDSATASDTVLITVINTSITCAKFSTKTSTVTLSTDSLSATMSATGEENAILNTWISGKKIWEIMAPLNANNAYAGISNGSQSLTSCIGYSTNSYSYSWNGYTWANGTPSPYGYVGFNTTDITTFEYDSAAGNLYIWHNGVNQLGTGVPAVTGLSGKWYPAVGCVGGLTKFTINAGASPFTYTPDAGYTGLCVSNADTIPPSVTAVNPVNLATGVSVYLSTITITFSKNVTFSTLNSTNIYVTDSLGAVFSGTVTGGSNYATISFGSQFAGLKKYYVNVNNVTNLTGYAMSSPFISQFTTGATPINNNIFYIKGIIKLH